MQDTPDMTPSVYVNMNQERTAESERSWKQSEMPHPLITLDWDEHDTLTGIGMLGSTVVPGLAILSEWFEEGGADEKQLMERFQTIPR